MIWNILRKRSVMYKMRVNGEGIITSQTDKACIIDNYFEATTSNNLKKAIENIGNGSGTIILKKN